MTEASSRTEALSSQLMRQHSIERSLDNFKKLGRNNLTAARVRSRVTSLKELWRSYQEGHVTLTQAIPVSTQSTLDYFSKAQFDKTEEVYNSALDHMMDCLEELEPFVSPHNQSVEIGQSFRESSSLSLLHLPPINMPPFDGSYADWETFRDRFTSLIIQNKDLNDFGHMHLASSLTGRAKETIANLAVTANNFKIAWQTLNNRYENKRRLLSFYLSALLDVSAVTRESATELQLLCDKVNIAVMSLRKLDRTPSKLWGDFLVHLTSQKLDSVTRKAWTLHTCHADTPSTYEALKRFLATRIRALEECAPTSSSKAASKPAASPRVHIATASDDTTLTCPLCKSRHFINVCPQFLSNSVSQRRELVKRFKRCFNCLSTRHSASDCTSKYSCRRCASKHHTILHLDADASSGPATVTSQNAQASQSAVEATSMHTSATPGATAQVLLATAWVVVKVASGRSVTVRALLDQGSEATFISENVAQLLRAKRIRMPISISAVGGIRVGTVQHAASIIISPRVSDAPPIEATALILPSLTSYAPKRVTDSLRLAHLSDLVWADADPTSFDPIQIIIGADIYSNII